MDPDLSIPDIPQDILLPQEYSLTGYSRSLLRNPFHASNLKKKGLASIYESKDKHELINVQNRPASSRRDRTNIDTQKENGLDEPLLKPVVNLEKILSEEQDHTLMDNVGQSMVRFEEQDQQTLHNRFMKQVNNVIHGESRPTTSETGTLYRPTTASTRASATPLGKTRSFALSEVGFQSRNYLKEDNEDNDTVVESNKSRPQTAAQISSNVYKKSLPKKVCEIEKAKVVVDFLQTSPLFARYRSKGSKSLADWKMIKKTEEQIEKSDFSVQEFMRDYVKKSEKSTNDKPRSKGGITVIQAEDSVSVKRESSIQIHDRGLTFLNRNSELKVRSSKNGSFLNRRKSYMIRKGTSSLMTINNIETNKYTEKNPECGRILEKIPLDRTPAEKNYLLKEFRNFKAFKKLSDFTLLEVVGSLLLQEYEANRAIFKQGDRGTAWYIILSGLVSVQVSRTGRIEDSCEVVKLYAGDGFGDLALVNDEPRAATVLSKDFCQVVYIDRTDFNRIVKFSYQKEIMEKILFLKKFPLLEDFNFSALKSVAQVMEWKRFQPGEYVLKEGDNSKNLCIIRNGEAVVARSTKIREKDNTIQVVIGRLGRYDYFGEEGVYALDSDPLNLISDQIASSIIAAKNTKELEIGVIGSFDAKNKITNIPRNRVHVKSTGETQEEMGKAEKDIF